MLSRTLGDVAPDTRQERPLVNGPIHTELTKSVPARAVQAVLVALSAKGPACAHKGFDFLAGPLGHPRDITDPHHASVTHAAPSHPPKPRTGRPAPDRSTIPNGSDEPHGRAPPRREQPDGRGLEHRWVRLPSRRMSSISPISLSVETAEFPHASPRAPDWLRRPPFRWAAMNVSNASSSLLSRARPVRAGGPSARACYATPSRTRPTWPPDPAAIRRGPTTTRPAGLHTGARGSTPTTLTPHLDSTDRCRPANLPGLFKRSGPVPQTPPPRRPARPLP